MKKNINIYDIKFVSLHIIKYIFKIYLFSVKDMLLFPIKLTELKIIWIMVILGINLFLGCRSISAGGLCIGYECAIGKEHDE